MQHPNLYADLDSDFIKLNVPFIFEYLENNFQGHQYQQMICYKMNLLVHIYLNMSGYIC
jgi:hypothetical protein